MAAIILGYIVLLVFAGLLGFYLGTKRDVDYEKVDLTTRGVFPTASGATEKPNRAFPYNHLRVLGIERLAPFKPQDEARDSLPPTRPDGKRAS